jgi:hypothetical protein
MTTKTTTGPGQPIRTSGRGPTRPVITKFGPADHNIHGRSGIPAGAGRDGEGADRGPG